MFGLNFCIMESFEKLRFLKRFFIDSSFEKLRFELRIYEKILQKKNLTFIHLQIGKVACPWTCHIGRFQWVLKFPWVLRENCDSPSLLHYNNPSSLLPTTLPPEHQFCKTQLELRCRRHILGLLQSELVCLTMNPPTRPMSRHLRQETYKPLKAAQLLQIDLQQIKEAAGSKYTGAPYILHCHISCQNGQLWTVLNFFSSHS